MKGEKNVLHRHPEREDSMPNHDIGPLRLREPTKEWDPTLWGIPLQSLPKRHKVHWDPMEWKIHLH